MANEFSKTTAAVLGLLFDLPPMTFDKVVAEAAARGLEISEDALSLALAELGNDYLVDRIPTAGQLDSFGVTMRGRAKLLAAAARNAFAADNEDPIEVRSCHHRDPEPPAVATVCLAEDELDDWWTLLDVDRKASLFVGHALLHAIEDRRIPVVGTIGRENGAEELVSTEHFKQGAAQ
jgi:hypothetical protein